MQWRIRVSLVLFATFLAAIYTVAQDSLTTATTKRPNIGLVLAGGAALGLAHIGVIQWLEEHRIPVSYVAGTSMGGLVGGLYGTGQSPRDMEELIEGIDWNDVLKGRTPFADLSYRRKEDDRDYPNLLEFGIRKGL